MEAKRICPYCMGELESRVSVCPHCGQAAVRSLSSDRQ